MQRSISGAGGAAPARPAAPAAWPARAAAWLRGQARYRPALALWLVFLAVSLATRLVLAGVALADGQVGGSMLPRMAVVGALFDAVTGLYACLPLLAALWLLPRRALRTRAARLLLWAGMLAACTAFLYLGAAEYFFFREFDARFNYVAVEYLIYPTEVFVNLRDSYPVGTALALACLAAAALVPVLRGAVRAALDDRAGLVRRSPLPLAALALAGLATAGMDLQTASVPYNRVAGELAANGVYAFFSALRNADIDYPRYYAGLPQAEAERRARAMVAQANTRFLHGPGGGHPLARHVDNSDLGPPRPRHVIILLQESLGAEFVGSLGGAGWTPNLDRIAAQSLSFTQVYATGTRTVRGMEAVATALPPVPPESVLKKRGYQDVFNLASIARQAGYSPTFIYGGYGSFDNMNAFFGANGWRTIDRTDLPPARFANIWGIDDEDLLADALGEYDAQVARGERVFSVVMSTSNHKPFTFPEGVPGVPAQGGGREAGVRYADHAIGRFFDALRRRPWYRDAMLVIVADHGARVYGREQVPVGSYAIPFVVHAPGMVEPGRDGTLASQADVAPTLLGLLRLSYDTRWFGRDILRVPPGQGYALFNHNRDVALLRGERLATLGFGGTVQTESWDGRSLAPVAGDAGLERDATAIFQVADLALRSGWQHNPSQQESHGEQ